jgi:hypothetical protein
MADMVTLENEYVHVDHFRHSGEIPGAFLSELEPSFAISSLTNCAASPKDLPTQRKLKYQYHIHFISASNCLQHSPFCIISRQNVRNRAKGRGRSQEQPRGER